MLAGKDIGFSEALLVSLSGIAVVLLELAVLAVLITLLSKAVRFFESKRKTAALQTDAGTSSGTPLPQTESAGQVKLINTDERTAAMIMAIVSNESGIPLNRLDFKYIKKLDD